MNLSKSKYTQGVLCKKLLWLSSYKKEEAIDTGNEAVFENGNKVGELARSLFGGYILISYDDGFQKMIEQTSEELKHKPNVICEASFSYDGNFCSVDILKNDIDGVELYEVKSSTKISDIYIDDIAYQTWVLKKCGLNVKKCFLVYVNDDYVKRGELQIQDYFRIKDLTNDIDLSVVENRVKEYKTIIQSDQEPNDDLSMSCHKPYDCPFFSYCTKNLPAPNVFDIGWNTHFDKKLELYRNGFITYEEILNHGGISAKADLQMDFELNHRNPKIDENAIRDLLSTFQYPLYFLDFESYQNPIPEIDGTKPYQQLCFQYSLHYY